MPPAGSSRQSAAAGCRVRRPATCNDQFSKRAFSFTSNCPSFTSPTASHHQTSIPFWSPPVQIQPPTAWAAGRTHVSWPFPPRHHTLHLLTADPARRSFTIPQPAACSVRLGPSVPSFTRKNKQFTIRPRRWGSSEESSWCIFKPTAGSGGRQVSPPMVPNFRRCLPMAADPRQGAVASHASMDRASGSGRRATRNLPLTGDRRHSVKPPATMIVVIMDSGKLRWRLLPVSAPSY